MCFPSRLRPHKICSVNVFFNKRTPLKRYSCINFINCFTLQYDMFLNYNKLLSFNC